MNARIFALYLPQFHPTSENDLWWGKGFTEWTNVGKAKKLFPGHYQPHVPADLGYYNLMTPGVIEQQAEMAKEAGIEGFCFYHYWFGNGRLLLEKPFEKILKSSKPDFPFMMCWANESWHCKFWNNDGTVDKKMLIEQLYPSEQDIIDHFNYLLPAFNDSRHIKIDGMPAFMIYRPLECENIKLLMKIWTQMAKENGMKGIYFIGQTVSEKDIDKIISLGFHSVNIVRLYDCLMKRSFVSKAIEYIIRIIFKTPYIKSYKKAIKYFIGLREQEENIIPTIYPNWDHTPRSGSNGYVLVNSTPELWGTHIDNAIKAIKDKSDDKKIIIVKSWNEWGEGNYLEPDLKFGKGYLDELRRRVCD